MAGAVLALGLAGPAPGESLNSTFSVRLYGAPVGRMVVAANGDGRAYAAKGEFRTTGLVGLLARVRFTMRARGVGTLPDLRARSYSEDLDTGYRASATSLSFGADDPRIDPLTAFIAALLDRPTEAGCAFDGQTFDGERSMRIRIRAADKSATGLTCSGLLQRLSGYTAEEMAEATDFPFTVEFTRSGEQLVVRRADVTTIHGQVALVRR
jgi:hypothetical protein